MEEVFKTIATHPDYEVSNCGRVKTKKRAIRYTHARTGEEHFRYTEERLLKEYLTVHGYKFVQLYKDKKSKNYNIHRLVALSFLDNPDALPIVNHKDGNKLNNTVENLEWCTNAYNHEHATKTGLKPRGSNIATSVLNERSLIAIRKLLKMGWQHKDIANLFEVSRSNITLISLNKTWQPSPKPN